MSRIRTRVLKGFDDPTLGQDAWQKLLEHSDTDSIYLTWHFQKAWWEAMGRGELLLIVAERDGEAVALAPFYVDARMVYFVGSAFESDCLDFIGDIGEPETLDALLKAARQSVPGFLGFELYFIPDQSNTARRLRESSLRLGLSCYVEDEMPAPLLDLSTRPELALAVAHRPRIEKLERAYRREGHLEVRHLRDGEQILLHLEEFVEQHIARWAGTDNPSRFLYSKAKHLIERFTQIAARTGWLRFTRVDWQGRAIAFHYGYCYDGRYHWGIPSFAPDLARRSPGQLLLRHLLLAAIEEGAHTFDFGTGDQDFKLRLASHVSQVRTLGLYPSSRSSPAAPASTLLEPRTTTQVD